MASLPRVLMLARGRSFLSLFAAKFLSEIFQLLVMLDLPRMNDSAQLGRPSRAVADFFCPRDHARCDAFCGGPSQLPGYRGEGEVDRKHAAHLQWNRKREPSTVFRGAATAMVVA